MPEAPPLSALSSPRLAAALDPARMRAVLAEHLRSVGGAATEVLAVRVAFARHRTDGRATLAYDVRLRDPATGGEREQVVTGVAYGGGRTRRAWESLRRQAPPAQAPGDHPALPPFAYVPALDLLLQVFPFDHRLPGLAAMLAGPPPELAAALLPYFGPGEWAVAGWAADPVRYRVDQRATLRVAVRARDSDGREAERVVYAKVYRKRATGAAAHRLLGWLRERVGTAFDVGEPVAWLPGPRTLVQTEAAGEPLSEVLLRPGQAAPAAQRVAAALAALHRSGVVVPGTRSLADDRVQLAVAQDLLRRARPDLGPRIGAVAAAVVAGLPEAEPTPTHGDLKPEHVLLEGARVALLDFDRATLGDPLHDVAQLLAVLARSVGRGELPRDGVRAASAALVGDYAARVPAAWMARLPLRTAAALLTAAAAGGRGVQDQGTRDAWAGRIEGLLLQAEEAAAGRLWWPPRVC